MSCTFEKEMLALYAGADLSAAEIGAVEGHIQDCAPCRQLVEEYRKGVGLVSDIGGGIRFPGSALPGRPARYSAKRIAVAAACGLVAALTLVSVSPAVAGFLASLGSITVQELTPTEMTAYSQELQANWKDPATLTFGPDGRSVDAEGNILAVRAVERTPEEAQELVPFQILQPGYLPEGFDLSSIRTLGMDVSLHYRGPRMDHLAIIQKQSDHRWKTMVSVPEGASELNSVGSAEAVLTRGHWGVNPDGTFSWTDGYPIRLIFERDGLLLDISSRDLPPEELIKVAESLQ